MKTYCFQFHSDDSITGPGFRWYSHSTPCDEDGVTIERAKELWEKNKKEFIKQVKDGLSPRVILWDGEDVFFEIDAGRDEIEVRNDELYVVERKRVKFPTN